MRKLFRGRNALAPELVSGTLECCLVIAPFVGRSHFRDPEVNCTGNAIEPDDSLPSDVSPVRA